MNKREFLSLLAISGISFSAWGEKAKKPAKLSQELGPGLLTVTGTISRANRKAFDPALDQLMKKHNVKFDRAHAFDSGALAALPIQSSKPTLEYDGKPHVLSGPLLLDVLQAAGATLTDKTKVVLRAIDGYAVVMPIADIRKYRMLVATHIDGQAMPLGGLGPLWAIYEADKFAEMNARPLNERFVHCPWGLYHIEVQT